MRSEKEMMELILTAAKEDERILGEKTDAISHIILESRYIDRFYGKCWKEL